MGEGQGYPYRFIGNNVVYRGLRGFLPLIQNKQQNKAFSARFYLGQRSLQK